MGIGKAVIVSGHLQARHCRCSSATFSISFLVVWPTAFVKKSRRPGTYRGTMLVAVNEGGAAYEALQDIAIDRTFLTPSRLMFDDTYERKPIGRWIFRSGRLPVVPRSLPLDCTVGEGWIAFDGDQYAAVVVASHVFALWLRIHGGMGNGPSHMRWTDQVLDAFPWPDGSFVLKALPLSARNRPRLFRMPARLSISERSTPDFRIPRRAP